MTIAILGCGPAGLMAAHAVEQQGHEVNIFSQKQPSPIGGAQYLHDQIPGLTGELPDGVITYLKMGDAAGYAEKVYGDGGAPTSWEKFPTGAHPCWSLRAAYLKLWEHFRDRIWHRVIWSTDIDHYCEKFELVLCTLPAQALCETDHEFKGQHVVLQPRPMIEMDNTIVYNGRLGDRWYRSSMIFGSGWTEYAGDSVIAPRNTKAGRDQRDDGWVEGVKPIETDCDCHLHHNNFFRLGRFGKWKKAVLTSDAYKDARLIAAEVPA